MRLSRRARSRQVGPVSPRAWSAAATALTIALVAPVVPVASASAPATETSAAAKRGSATLVVRIGGNRFGEKARVVVKGTKGSARGITRTRWVTDTARFRRLPTGKYRVRVQSITVRGWTTASSPAKRNLRLRGDKTRTRSFTYRVVSRPQTSSSTNTTPSGSAAVRRTWYQGWWWIDLNGDGRWDTTAQDPQRTGRSTNLWSDTNFDGYYDLHWWDATGEGQMDSLKLDPDFNRTLDAYLWDSTGDGQLDTGYSDASGRRIVSLRTAAGVNAAINTTSLQMLTNSHNYCTTMDWCNTGNSIMFPTITPPSLLP